jgi:beta-xylosidase
VKYTNPILMGDYSDPDIVRAGKDYYMISSSFTYLPGIPVLHSRDLVHWETIGYAAKSLPFRRYDAPAHKYGTWAPSIRYQNGLFYIYVCLPDEGLFAFTAKDPAGEWDCHYVKDVCGWIDPCPLWDDDGRAYLLHGFAASRCGINNILYLHEMSADGFSILDKGKLVYDGASHGDVTVEGPKMYKRGKYYYILCPAGGVKTGYQLALRALSPYGEYERRVVLEQGDTPVNGPHQGGLVDTGRGQDWFVHFQDVEAYGRIVHLQPVSWKDDWMLMGDGGKPVAEWEYPDTGEECGCSIRMSDDFAKGLSKQWQWQANPNPAWFSVTENGLRLYSAPSDSLFHAGQFLSQLMLSFCFDMEVRVRLNGIRGDRAGIGMMGYRYAYAAVENDRIVLVSGSVREINRFERERVTETVLCSMPLNGNEATLRMSVRDGKYRFLCGVGGGALAPLGDEQELSAGGWTGARPGIFCFSDAGNWGGYADFEYCRVTGINGEAL